MNYTKQKIIINSDGKNLSLIVLTPKDNKKIHTGVLWIHGGGFITGMAGMYHITRAIDLVVKCGAVVVTPEYRLAGTAPYPAALHDCHNALVWMSKHTNELKIRENQIMVGGESAGGGLTASLCMYELDNDGVKIAYQMPLYPMLDCFDTVSSRNNNAPVWNTKRNHYGWSKYLGNIDRSCVPCYASAARRKDYSSLPPAYTFVCDAEPFYAETVTYIENLQKAGVHASLDIYPGLFHAFDIMLPFHRTSRIAAKKFLSEFMYASEHYFT